MSNEELVTSLRTEIQTYLKNTVADLQQEIAEMQERVNSEIERHRGELEKSFHDLLLKGSAANVDDNFVHVISEHLQMAFEDGSKEAAEAARVEAANLSSAAAAAAGGVSDSHSTDYTATRDAINEISYQTSQADILKSLVKHSSSFVPRGAFFIVKSEHLVGWRVFGNEVSGGDEKVREVFLSVNSNTVLGESVRQNAVQHAARGEFAEDAQFLKRLDFGAPAQMIAIPLVVRGRGVAVLYADAGENGSAVQTEALESLVRVAGLTVELLASAKSSTPKSPSAAPQTVNKTSLAAAESSSKELSYNAPPSNSAFNASPSAQSSNFEAQTAESSKTYPETFNEDKNGGSSSGRSQTAHENYTSTQEFTLDSATNTARSNEIVEAPVNSFENFSTQSFDKSAVSPAPNSNDNAFSFETTMPSYNAAAAPVEAELVQQSEVQTQAGTPRRFGERNPELPINVPEDERRLHNDARRFARLLVSEIKLYNEQKVKEGRQARDLYGRLREAIERSREMYDKRVAPPVAARFDYFHYELVNTLAEGEERKLGEDYPGAAA